jgi:hypothetical protein
MAGLRATSHLVGVELDVVRGGGAHQRGRIRVVRARTTRGADWHRSQAARHCPRTGLGHHRPVPTGQLGSVSRATAVPSRHDAPKRGPLCTVRDAAAPHPFHVKQATRALLVTPCRSAPEAAAALPNPFRSIPAPCVPRSTPTGRLRPLPKSLRCPDSADRPILPRLMPIQGRTPHAGVSLPHCSEG